MRLNSVGPHSLNSDGVAIPQPVVPEGELWRQIIEDANRRRRRIGDQVGLDIPVPPGLDGHEITPFPPHRGDCDDDDGDNGITTFDM